MSKAVSVHTAWGVCPRHMLFTTQAFVVLA